jgi:hypothetical protein
MPHSTRIIISTIGSRGDVQAQGQLQCLDAI